jgi:hypothetical protein
MNSRPNPLQAHQALTVSTTAQTLAGLGLTANVNTDRLLIGVEGAAVRVTVNGTTPVAGSLGFTWSAGSIYNLSRVEADVAKFVSDTGSPVTLQIAGYKL